MSKLNEKEANILLAKSAFQRGQFKSIRAAAASYNVPPSTLTTRINGTTSRVDSIANGALFTPSEEEVIIRHILDLDSRGFSPKMDEVRDMANFLLKTRSIKRVGQRWPYNFVKRTPQLRTRLSRRYDYQRAQCEDPAIMRPWFDLIALTIAKYGIIASDIYNFDETGFAMGVAKGHLVVTASERRSNPKKLHPGNRSWTTVIACVNAEGHCLPPYIIFAGKEHQTAWFSSDIPPSWALGVSPKGWTTNEHGLKWLHHFNKWTRGRTIGTHRLLIVDGHESHESLEFKQYCEQNNIIPLCMPPHASHYLQPLDVGCFGPLKKAYCNQVNELIRYGINHVDKTDFLAAFYPTWQAAMTESNIQGAFRGSGVYPLDANVVLDKLDINIRGLTPEVPSSSQSTWQAQTPTNTREIECQTELIKGRMANLPGSSPISVIQHVGELAKCANRLATELALVQRQLKDTQEANALLSKRKARKKRRITGHLALSNEEGLEIMEMEEVMAQIRREETQGGTANGNRAVASRRCGLCREPGHRRETCQLRQLASADS